MPKRVNAAMPLAHADAIRRPLRTGGIVIRRCERRTPALNNPPDRGRNLPRLNWECSPTRTFVNRYVLNSRLFRRFLMQAWSWEVFFSGSIAARESGAPGR